uniref:Uncharacterized protein n=1 Tax=Panagrolaimus sp. ES5 TaxID=591445 RepID=A0AC34F6I5_9BILA
MSRITAKLWITDELSVFDFDKTQPHLVSSIFPKIYQSNVSTLKLCNQIISYSEYLIFSSNVQNILLDYITVQNVDGSIVSLEKLFKSLSKIKSFFMYDSPACSGITSNTFKELLKLQHFSKIDKFVLGDISEIFVIDSFFTYVKKNKHTKFSLWFNNSISAGFKNRLEAIVDEIIETKTRNYKSPIICFPGIDYEKREKMISFYRS